MVCNKVYIGVVVLKGRWYTDVRREPADRTWHLDTLIIENPGVFIQTEMRWWWWGEGACHILYVHPQIQSLPQFIYSQQKRLDLRWANVFWRWPTVDPTFYMHILSNVVCTYHTRVFNGNSTNWKYIVFLKNSLFIILNFSKKLLIYPFKNYTYRCKYIFLRHLYTFN